MTNPELHKLLDTLPKSNLHVARVCLELLQADNSAARFEARLESAPLDEEISASEIEEILISRQQAHEEDQWVSLDDL